MSIQWIEKIRLQSYFNRIWILRNHPTVRALITLLVITLVAAGVVEIFEAQKNDQFTTFWDSVWWVLVTITTVGYGDKVPLTPAGKILGIIIMFLGIALLSVITATISSIFVARKINEGKGLHDIKTKDHILICGWNANVNSILSTLESSGKSQQEIVLINQLSEEDIADIISRFPSLHIQYVRGDFSRDGIQIRANAKSAVAALILADESVIGEKSGDEKTILATLSLKALNPKIKVYAHILDRENIPHLTKARADEIIVSDSYTGFLMANFISAPGVSQLITQLCKVDASNKLVRRMVPSELTGKNYVDLKSLYQEKQNGILLGIGQMTEPFDLSDLMRDDTSSLDEFIMRKFQEAGRGVNSAEQTKIRINPPGNTVLSKKDFYLSIERSKQ